MKKLIALTLLSCCPAVWGFNGYILFQTDPALAGGAATSPYSLLISGTYPAFATTANGGKVANTVFCGANSIVCPADLVFTRDAECTQPFAGWDVFIYSPVTGRLGAVVEVPTLSSVTPTKVYACVGDAAQTDYQGGERGAAYDSHYLLALHMEEISGTTLYDSTANANDAGRKAVNSPAPTASGQMGAGQTFHGAANTSDNDYALFQALTKPANTYTIEYWIKVSSYSNRDSVFLERSTVPITFVGLFWYPAGQLTYYNQYNTSLSPAPPTTLGTGVFHSVAFVRNGDSMNVYVDGNPGTAQAGFGTDTEQWKGLGWDGGASAAINSFNGVLDEVYYSDVARSPAYLTARFNNVNNPSSFCVAGPYTPFAPRQILGTGISSQVNIY